MEYVGRGARFINLRNNVQNLEFVLCEARGGPGAGMSQVPPHPPSGLFLIGLINGARYVKSVKINCEDFKTRHQTVTHKGKIMDKAKNAEEYIAKQREAIAMNEECGASHYNLAVALIGMKKYEEAEKELHETINCSPTFAEAYVQLGGICLRKGDLDGCLAYNQQAIRSRAAFAEGHGNIGFVHMQKGNVDDAIASLKKAISYNKNFVQAYATLANAYLMKGLIDESIETSKKALDISPDFAVAHNNLTIAYLENDCHDLAAESCERALKLGYKVAPEILNELEKYRRNGE